MSFKYNYGRTQFATKQIGWTVDTIKSLLVNAGYAPNPADQFVADIPSGAIAIRGSALAGKTVVDGYCRATTTRYPDLLLPQEIIGIVLYKDTGDDATSVLLAYGDHEQYFPFTPTGFHYDFAWDAGFGGFFRL